MHARPFNVHSPYVAFIKSIMVYPSMHDKVAKYVVIIAIANLLFLRVAEPSFLCIFNKDSPKPHEIRHKIWFKQEESLSQKVLPWLMRDYTDIAHVAS